MTEQTLILPYPPTLNTNYINVKGRGRVPSAKYTAWTKETLWLIAAQKPIRYAGQVEVNMYFVPPDRRARDLDNLQKPCLDILKKAGVIIDDDSRYVRRITAEWLSSGEPTTIIVTTWSET